MYRVHIIGPPRSGTTLMLELMSNGFDFTARNAYETSLLNMPEGLDEVDSYITKRPRDHQLVASVIERDERQWFISMIRDPRDIVSSRHRLHPEVYWANLRQWREWLENTRPFRQHPRLIEVRYEELVNDPDTVQKHVANRLPCVRQTHAFSRFHQHSTPSGESLTAMGGVRPVSDSSVGNWRDNLARVAGQLKIHGSITEELVELGYETDANWLDLLDGVQPDTSSGHWPEFIPPKYAAKKQRQLEAQIETYLRERGL